MRNSDVRTKVQALVVFLFKLRTGNSNEVIATVFELDSHQKVSAFFTEVLKSFEKDILPVYGFSSLTRNDLLANTSPTAKKLLSATSDQLILICDGTYVRHQKSKNNEYQRKSYSGQKKTHLCKPFTICTSNGFVLDFFGPFNGTLNDATIIKEILQDNSFKSFLRPNDVFVLDRGFRDAVNHITELGYVVHMPALKGQRAQLPTEEANMSRRVTKIRWVVEAVHGVISQKYGLLHRNLDNKLLPKLKSICKIVGFLHNRFGKRLATEDTVNNAMIDYLESRMDVPNTLSEEVEVERWNRRKTKLQQLDSSQVLDFPRLSEEELKVLFTGSYQLSLAVAYIAELLDEQNKINMSYVKERSNIIKVEVRSRHINRKYYRVYIEYVSGGIVVDDIKRYCCDCPNGLRTVGCCAHVALFIIFTFLVSDISAITY